jgi:Trk K+ transport system NAD-binding subunit
MSLAALTDHVVILNVNDKVGRIIDEIALGTGDEITDIVVLVQDRGLWQANPDWRPQPESRVRLHLVYGCPTEPDDLTAVAISSARAAVILADPRQGRLADAHSTLIAVAIERRCPQVHTVTELIESVNRVHLRATEVNEVICFGELTEKLIAQSCITPGITNVFADLLHAHPGTTQVFVVNLPAALAGLRYRQLARRTIEAGAPFILCGFTRPGPVDPVADGAGLVPRETILLNPRAGVEPGRDTVLEPDDRLVVIAYTSNVVEELEAI